MSDLVLGIDTTGHGGAVALADAGRVVALEEHDPSTGYAEELFGLFDRVLDAAGRRRGDIGRVVVLTGPGSFTGLRIGVMTAKTLAFALDRPLFGAGTLEALAGAAGPGEWTAVAEAGGGQVWRRRFAVDEGAVRALDEIARVPADRVEGSLVSAPPLSRGRVIEGLAGVLALLTAQGMPPAREVDPVALVPEYVGLSQAERVHGVDLSEELRRPIEPRGWQT